jgi:transglutaminase-like putative cysteine protease
MRLKIEHITTFTYDKPISEAYTEMCFRPQDIAGQHCLSFSLKTEPQEDQLNYLDRFGNEVSHFDVIQPHQKLVVAANSLVMTPDHFIQPSPDLPPLDEFDFLHGSTYTPLLAEIAAVGNSLVVPGDPRSTALAIMSYTHSALKYEKGATDVTTTASEALALGRGVCQDFSHLMLAACRSQKIPARYVSGYLYNNGYSAASHAWVDVFIQGEGWLSLDPTHNRAQTAEYVRVATGRDYADVPPTRGVFVGNAKESMEVSVTVDAV